MEKKVCDEIGNTPRKEHNIPKCETRQIPKIPAQDRVSCSLGKLVCPESRATYRSTAIFLFPTLGISRRGTRAPRNLTDLLSRLFIFETKRHGVIIIIAMDGVHGRKTQPVGSINSVFRPIVKMPDNGGIPGRNCGAVIVFGYFPGEGTCRSIDLSRLSSPESVKRSEDGSRIFTLGRVDIFKLGLKKGSMVENDLSLLSSALKGPNLKSL